jgi:glycosyltransferase involved in cell wall biosynthesis
VPEGIDEGLTGFVCDTVEQMMTAVSRVGELDRAQCRAVAERRFSRQAIADEYERLYLRLRAS